MKTATIICAEDVTITDGSIGGKDLTIIGSDKMSVSDGFHTIDELYDHRITLWIVYCKLMARVSRAVCPVNITPVWKSKVHSDGRGYEGWFILGLDYEKGKQKTYHLPIEKWDECEFAKTLKEAPEWDGHTSADVLERLKKL